MEINPAENVTRSQSSQPGATSSLEAPSQRESSISSMSTLWPVLGMGSRDTFFGRGGLAVQPLSSTQRIPRVYEVWPEIGSSNRFACCGRCVTGPQIDLWYNLCAWFFILVPTGLYFVICTDHLWQRGLFPLPILTGVVLLTTIIFLLLTSCTDPGILPRRRLRQMLPGLEEEVSNMLALPEDLQNIVADGLNPPILPEVRQAQGYKWCSTCQVVRPPRASHCDDCGNCVLTFDHHCPFVNNCIGQRNYLYFNAFLISTGCLGFSVAVGFGIKLSGYEPGVHGNLEWSPLLIIFLILVGLPTAFFLLGVIVLMMFHIFLVCTGKTTKEVLTGRRVLQGRSIFERPPSLIHARAQVDMPIDA